MEIHRLFDLLPYMQSKYPPMPVQLAGKIAGKIAGKWKTYTLEEYIEISNAVSYGFLALGLERGDKVAIISSNRPEWNFLDMGLSQIGAIPVPIYPTISESDYLHILNHAEVKYVFSEGAELLSKIEHILPQIPSIKDIFTFVDRGKYRYFETLIALGRQHPQPGLLESIKASIGPSDLATIIFTSGTTGNSKGVMLSHSNVINNFTHCAWIPPARAGAHALSFLPLCHVYERMMCYLYHYNGYAIYYAENIGTIVADAKEVQPEIMTSVPRILEKMYDKIYMAGEQMPFFRKRIYYWALELATRYKLRHRSWLYKGQHYLADRLVYAKLRQILGGKLSTIVSGGAAIQDRLARFFTAVGYPIAEGYGLSETSPVIAVSNFTEHGRKFGTVGPPLKGVEVKIAPDGEICCRGHNVMMGYYKQAEETAAVFDAEGWFHTGDLGQFEKHGQLRITGRKKNIFKTSFGKYVNPILIEEKFKESPFIDNLMVIGEGQKFAGALITLDWNFVEGWWARKKMGEYPKDRQSILDDPRIKRRMMREVAKYNKFFGDYEQIKKFRVLPDEWTPQSRELTPTLKIRRNHVEPLYAEEIQKLFA